MKANYKKNKGYIATDALIAIMIILIIIPTLTGMIYNISKTENAINRKTQAINIAVNAMEVAKGLYVKDLEKGKILETLNNMNLYEKKIDNDGIITLNECT